MSETPYVMNKIFFSKYSSDDDKQLQPWSKFDKKQVKVLKTMQMSQKVLFSLISYIKCLYKGIFT